MRLAIVGACHRASLHATAAHSLGIEVVVVDYRTSMRERFAAQHDIARVYTTMDRLWADGGADAVCLCPPFTSHAAGCMTAGVPVMVEPPFAADADIARELMRTSERTGTPLMAAFAWRFDAGVRWLRAQVISGDLGPTLHSRGSASLHAANLDSIDTARFLLGDPEPRAVYAEFDRQRDECAGREAGTVTVIWSTGAVSVIETGPDAATTVCGTRGFGRSAPPHSQYFDPCGHTQTGAAQDAGCLETTYREQMSHFVKCAARGEQPSVGGTHAYLSLCIMDAAAASARIGRAIEL